MEVGINFIAHLPPDFIQYILKKKCIRQFFAFYLAYQHKLHYTLYAVGTSAVGGGEFTMGHIAALLISVIAGVISHYICKWLDRTS